ncbi:MAG: hypothetical protein LC797_17655 [Chloroflexi bacterium]|nr:hypothetical protein [Chloroflexota bacterium]
MDNLEPELSESDSISARLKIIFEQVERVQSILREAHGRRLDPQERLAVAELAQAFAELTDAARSLLAR